VDLPIVPSPACRADRSLIKLARAGLSVLWRAPGRAYRDREHPARITQWARCQPPMRGRSLARRARDYRAFLRKRSTATRTESSFDA